MTLLVLMVLLPLFWLPICILIQCITLTVGTAAMIYGEVEGKRLGWRGWLVLLTAPVSVPCLIIWHCVKFLRHEFGI